jgi:plastocyanin
MRFGVALVLGLLAAFLVVQFPASAADQSIQAVSNTGWSNEDFAIDVNDSVTWTNTTGFSHNVCVRRSNVSSGCAEYRNADPSSSWPVEGYTHQFTSDGTFTFLCQVHAGMRGMIKVGTGDNPPVDTGTGTNTGTGTGTSTTPPPGSQPTDAITNPTQTQTETQTTNAAPADTTKPALGSVKRRASRTALIVTLTSSEDAVLKATVSRRPPRGRSFGRLSQKSVQVKQGKNVVTLMRLAKSRRSGAFRIKLQLVDAAGNRSLPKTLNFKIA